MRRGTAGRGGTHIEVALGGECARHGGNAVLENVRLVQARLRTSSAHEPASALL